MQHIPIRNIQSSSAEPDLSGTFSIRTLEDVLDGKNLVQELHRHDFFYVLALTKGSGTHEIDFISYEVNDHTVFFMRPGHVHSLTLNAGSIGYLMQFKTDFYYPTDATAATLLRGASHKNLCKPDPKRFTRLLTILHTMYEEFNEKQEGYLDVVKANLGIFFIELVRHRKRNNGAIDHTHTYAGERLDELLELFEKYIFTHKQVSQYAEMLHLSVYQLNTITKSTLGKTCSELINEQIILEAKRYLLATANQVTQIAYHLGYDDVSYFIRFFKKHTGHTPETFRQHFR